MTDNARSALLEARSQMGRVAQMAQRVIQLGKPGDVVFETATALKADAERAIQNLNEAMGE